MRKNCLALNRTDLFNFLLWKDLGGRIVYKNPSQIVHKFELL